MFNREWLTIFSKGYCCYCYSSWCRSISMSFVRRTIPNLEGNILSHNKNEQPFCKIFILGNVKMRVKWKNIVQFIEHVKKLFAKFLPKNFSLNCASQSDKPVDKNQIKTLLENNKRFRKRVIRKKKKGK